MFTKQKKTVNARILKNKQKMMENSVDQSASVKIEADLNYVLYLHPQILLDQLRKGSYLADVLVSGRVFTMGLHVARALSLAFHHTSMIHTHMQGWQIIPQMAL